MKYARYNTRLEPIEFAGRRFHVPCADVVIRNRVTDYILEKGGCLSVQEPDYVIRGLEELPSGTGIQLTYIQFWLAAGEADRIQMHEWVEGSLAWLGADSAIDPVCEEKVVWYIRDNREKLLGAMVERGATDPIGGYLSRCSRLLPERFARITQDGDYGDQILLDLIDELIEQASQLEKHEVKAWLLEYKRSHLTGSFVEETRQADMEKEMGFQERSEYDWMKLFDYTTEGDGVRIHSYKGTDDLVFVPAEIGGKPVVSVHVRNFYADDRNLQFYWEQQAPGVDFAALRQAEVGDTVLFGRYPQTKASQLLPIEWQVLKKEDSRLLVISTRCLDKAAYHRDVEHTDWEHCHLRAWLNGPFYQLAFTPEEQSMIPEITISNAPNEKYGTPGGRDTMDHVFVLSGPEAAALFPGDSARVGYTTDYHQVQGYYFGGKINCWWLRTPGVEPDYVMLIGNSGSVGTYGYRLDNNEYAVRPAMWIETGGGV